MAWYRDSFTFLPLHVTIRTHLNVNLNAVLEGTERPIAPVLK
jgi:hypothetical protein